MKKPNRPGKGKVGNDAPPQQCAACPHHVTVTDRDPHDAFNDDDVAVACKLVPNPKRNEQSIYLADHSRFRIVECACRPYQVGKVQRPGWCPLLAQITALAE